MRRALALALALVFSTGTLARCQKEVPVAYTGGILYSWSMSALEDEGKDKLLTWVEQLDIRTLYQDFDSEFLNAGDDGFLAEMAALGVEVLHLGGTPEWTFAPQRMIEEIDRVLHFNSVASTAIAGVVFDVEPHAVKSYQEPEDYFQFVQSMEQVYAYAQKHGLYMVLVIPYWLERVDDSLLPDIIGRCSDEVSVMNYYISKTTAHLAEELELARQHEKPLNTIYELNFGKSNTFGSLDEVHADFIELYSAYNYTGLRIAYHHLGDLE